MSLWIERAARKVRERSLLERTRDLCQIALAGAEPCEYWIATGPDGELFISSKGGWALERFLAEHGSEAAWRLRRDRHGVEIEGRQGAARCRLQHALMPVNPGPPRAGSARLLPAASG